MATCKTHAKTNLVRLRGTARSVSRSTRASPDRRTWHLTGPRTKKALIIGINYTQTGGNGTLFRSIADALEAKKTLLDIYRFKEEDIILLVDEEGGSDQPTHDMIVQELQSFVKTDNSNVDYVFIYVGHASQLEAKSDKEEEDGKAEYIIPLDAWSPFGRTPTLTKAIYDYELRYYLVDRLGRGSKLLAIFDTCHSGTLLSVSTFDLPHHKCHRCGSSVRRLGRKEFDPFQMSVVREASASSQCTRIFSRLVPWRIRSARARTKDLCAGSCHTDNSDLKYPRVICISGCQDGEMTAESKEEPTMISSLMKLFRVDSQPTFHQISDNLRKNVKQTRYKSGGKDVKHTSSNAPTIFSRKRDFLANLHCLHRHISAKLKSWHPDLMTEHPFDMKQKLIVCLP